MEVDVVRTIHWWPETVGAHRELTEAPTPAAVSVAPHGGVLSLDLRFPSSQSASSVFYQNTLGPLGGEDGSGLDYRALLETTLGQQGTGESVWLTCGDCSDDAAELTEYLSVIRPRAVVPHHWDGLMPALDAGIPAPFDPEPGFAQAMANVEVLPPLQYFDRFLLQGDSVVRLESAPIRSAFGLPDP